MSLRTIEDTTAFIRQAHAGQTDKGGKPYHLHPERVLQRLVSRWPDISIDARHAALLHDVMEDCAVTRNQLLRAGYSEATVAIVELLSSNQPMHQGRSYREKIQAIAASGNLDAVKVKLADIEDNSDPNRPLPPGMNKLRERYQAAQRVLAAALDRS